MKKNNINTKIGTVVSNKMNKTIVVEVVSQPLHPLYKKRIKKTTRYKVHDNFGAKVGSIVKIVETRPISKDVNFKVLEVLG